jgi:hypothetical protein
MSSYEFIKTESVRLNGRNVNVYNVYKNGIEEVSETVEACERGGVTVVTSEAKHIKVDAGVSARVLVGKAYGKNKIEAEHNFFNAE